MGMILGLIASQRELFSDTVRSWQQTAWAGQLPSDAGFAALLQRLRQRSAMPVVFLTSKDEEVDELMGLRLGADDYIVKPFSPREVIARIKAVLRRLVDAGTRIVQYGYSGAEGADVAEVVDRAQAEIFERTAARVYRL